MAFDLATAKPVQETTDKSPGFNPEDKAFVDSHNPTVDVPGVTKVIPPNKITSQDITAAPPPRDLAKPEGFDLSTAKPVQQPEGDSTSTKLGTPMIGMAEETLHAVSGMAGQAVGGWRGIYDIATGKGAEQAAKDIKSTQEAMTYEPQTAIGQGLTSLNKSGNQVSSQLLDKAKESMGLQGQQVTDKWHSAGYSPETSAKAGAYVDTALSAIGYALAGKLQESKPEAKGSSGGVNTMKTGPFNKIREGKVADAFDNAFTSTSNSMMKVFDTPTHIADLLEKEAARRTGQKATNTQAVIDNLKSMAKEIRDANNGKGMSRDQTLDYLKTAKITEATLNPILRAIADDHINFFRDAVTGAFAPSIKLHKIVKDFVNKEMPESTPLTQDIAAASLSMGAHAAAYLTHPAIIAVGALTGVLQSLAADVFNKVMNPKAKALITEAVADREFVGPKPGPKSPPPPPSGGPGPKPPSPSGPSPKTTAAEDNSTIQYAKAYLNDVAAGKVKLAKDRLSTIAAELKIPSIGKNESVEAFAKRVSKSLDQVKQEPTINKNTLEASMKTPDKSGRVEPTMTEPMGKKEPKGPRATPEATKNIKASQKTLKATLEKPSTPLSDREYMKGRKEIDKAVEEAGKERDRLSNLHDQKLLQENQQLSRELRATPYKSLLDPLIAIRIFKANMSFAKEFMKAHHIKLSDPQLREIVKQSTGQNKIAQKLLKHADTAAPSQTRTLQSSLETNKTPTEPIMNKTEEVPEKQAPSPKEGLSERDDDLAQQSITHGYTVAQIERAMKKSSSGKGSWWSHLESIPESTSHRKFVSRQLDIWRKKYESEKE